MPEEFHAMVENDTILGAAFHDHGRQEEIINSTNLEWTIVRPTEIIDSEETGSFTINSATERSSFTISKHDVAQFIVNELNDNAYLGQAVMITS